jgi:hypothetical protein
MEKEKWMQDMNLIDSKMPTGDIEGEVVYTLYQRDFLSMPGVDFSVLVEIDPDIRSLLN